MEHSVEMDRAVRRTLTALALLVGLAVVAGTLGCAGRGAQPPENPVRQIEPAVTTQGQIRAWFGDPDTVAVDSTGGAQWGYARDLQRSRLRAGLAAARRWVHRAKSFLESSVYYPPRSLPVVEKSQYSLTVSFAPDGVVSEFAYRRVAAR